MKCPRFDPSILCFVLVVAAAIPVAILRSRTYAVGYELGKLKKQERELHLRNIDLQSELAQVQRKVRDKYVSRSSVKKLPTELELPTTQTVLHGRDANSTQNE